MLKKRIIPIQLLIGDRLVKTTRFGAWRDVGDPVASSKVYSAQNADELVFLNIDRGERSVDPLMRVLERVSAVCFMPLALGGGVTTAGDAERLIRHGADKVVINSAAYADPAIISAVAARFGAQAAMVAIDAVRDGAGWRLVSDCGRRAQAVALEEHVERVVAAGAGEILVTSVDRDGTMTGYDLDLVRAVAARCRVPVIAAGGAGTYEHLRAAFVETGVSAVACGSLFNFGDNNPIRAKAHLSNHALAFKVV